MPAHAVGTERLRQLGVAESELSIIDRISRDLLREAQVCNFRNLFVEIANLETQMVPEEFLPRNLRRSREALNAIDTVTTDVQEEAIRRLQANCGCRPGRG